MYAINQIKKSKKIKNNCDHNKSYIAYQHVISLLAANKILSLLIMRPFSIKYSYYNYNDTKQMLMLIFMLLILFLKTYFNCSMLVLYMWLRSRFFICSVIVPVVKDKLSYCSRCANYRPIFLVTIFPRCLKVVYLIRC